MKDINYYKNLSYTYLIRPMHDESGDYFYGRVVELDGCQSSGDSFDETFANLREAMEGYIETKLAHGFEIPEPSPDRQEYSGRFNVRIPKNLHQRLAFEAGEQGVSLNQYVLYKLARQ